MTHRWVLPPLESVHGKVESPGFSWKLIKVFWVPLEQSQLFSFFSDSSEVRKYLCFILYSSSWMLEQWNSSALTSPSLKSPFLLLHWLWQITPLLLLLLPTTSSPSIILSPGSLFPSSSCLPGFLSSPSDSMHSYRISLPASDSPNLNYLTTWKPCFYLVHVSGRDAWLCEPWSCGAAPNKVWRLGQAAPLFERLSPIAHVFFHSSSARLYASLFVCILKV